MPPTNGSTSRAARALIGWMSPAEAEGALALLAHNGGAPVDHAGRAQAAREAVAARPEFTPPAHAVHEPNDALVQYADALREQPGVTQFLGEGWEVAMVDVGPACPLHPIVFVEDHDERVSGADADDVVSLAAVSLPSPASLDLPVQHDPVNNTFTISSPNPNLRILASSAGQSSLGMRGFVFQVGITPSFVKVARIGDRLIVCDGHHRALAFLRRGINAIPALVRRFTSIQELHLSPGMFPAEVVLGDRPPTLADYLDDAVSADVMRPAANKVIVIQALELRPLG